nr:pseudouridine synthase [Novosphingobium sp. G106]
MSPTPEPSETPAGARAGERIAKLLARAGIASRREVERMIAEGRVKLGEDVITTPNTVLANLKGVSVDGKPVKAAEPARLFVFHKPSGLITAERDPAGRPTIYTALRNALPEGTPRLMPVGRLDFNTEGLLLLTNDGELKRALELPATGIPRTYRARTFGPVTQAQLEELIEGIEIDGMRYGKIDANMERSTGANQWIEVTLTEGKNREVRRVLEHLGLEVSRLLRTSYGPFELLDLPRGAAVEIRQVDVEKFRKSLKVPGSADFTPRTVEDRPRTQPARPAREPERPLSKPKPAVKKPLARKPDPEKAGLETRKPRPPRPGGKPDGKPGARKPHGGKTGGGRPNDRRGPRK